MVDRDETHAAHTDRRTGGLTRALWLLAWIWLFVGAGPMLATVIGGEAALLGSFGIASALAVTDWRRSPVRGAGGAPSRVACAGIAAAGLGGLAYPALCLWIAVVGLRLGLTPIPSATATSTGAVVWLATCVLAPVFEEILYRGRLLTALERELGPALALVVSSAAFALPHCAPHPITHHAAWALLGTFVAGHALGALWLGRRRVHLCIGMHAGLNLAARLAATGWAP